MILKLAVIFLFFLMEISAAGKKLFKPSLLSRLTPLQKYDLEEVTGHLNMVYYNRGELPLSSTSYKLSNIEDLLDNSQFNINIKTIIYCPGYLEPLNATNTTTPIITAYTNKNYNILQIDWTYYSAVDYFKEAMPSIPVIAKIIAAAIDQLIQSGVPRYNINLIGHSLGCQIVGTIGRNLIQQVPLVVGLDCAGPGFPDTGSHFSKMDGMYTIALHTDSGFYGTMLNDAHLDLHINGGIRFQPGCTFLTIPFSLSQADLCSHQRSTLIWADILNNRDDAGYLAINCNSFQYLRRTPCSKINPVQISENIRGVLGVYYLSTKAEAPFSKGLEGI